MYFTPKFHWDFTNRLHFLRYQLAKNQQYSLSKSGSFVQFNVFQLTINKLYREIHPKTHDPEIFILRRTTKPRIRLKKNPDRKTFRKQTTHPGKTTRKFNKNKKLNLEKRIWGRRRGRKGTIGCDDYTRGYCPHVPTPFPFLTTTAPPMHSLAFSPIPASIPPSIPTRTINPNPNFPPNPTHPEKSPLSQRFLQFHNTATKTLDRLIETSKP